MDAAVHDKAVQDDEVQANIARSSPSEVKPSARQTSEFDDIARRTSEGRP